MRFMAYTAGIMLTIPLILHSDMTTLLGVSRGENEMNRALGHLCAHIG